ncbi:MAG: dihydrofolate reductase [Ardenticatenaceae bacterium]|nr:dihydrofolate reductase [Ardenticatenaceae bacterium]MCB8986655.1 dihydrofolate reductase [Ardenticatenaceae bacterium]
MIISLIAAMDKNRVIGQNGRLPWRLPADMQHFVALTMGKPVIMGRKTYDSIQPKYKPLHGRTNIILTHNRDYEAPGCIVIHTIDQALAAAAAADEVMVIGGAAVYRQFLPHADRLYLTIIHAAFDGDAQFPPYDESAWTITAREAHEPDEKNPYSYEFITLEKQETKDWRHENHATPQSPISSLQSPKP